MKITNITPGLIPIPPNGWGAVEKIIWEFHNNLLILGHDSHITYLDEVPMDSDIVHIHIANLALMAHERGIPYYFTMHDHHAYLYGKESNVYKQNLEAMKHAIKAFVPAKYLVEYFEGIPEYFSHGVNALFFNTPERRQHHKLLCVANNGYAHDQTIDRKGFGIAIEAAKRLELPITIAGPSNNKKYFEKYPSTYSKLDILYDLNEEQLRDVYKTHTIFLHPSEMEAGHPNLTLLEALSCGLPIVGTLEEHNSLNGMIITKRSVDEIVRGIHQVIQSYKQFSNDARTQAEQLSWMNRTKELLSTYTTKPPMTMKTQLLHHYNTTKQLNKLATRRFNYNNINGMFAEILRGPNTTYDVKFINNTTNEIVYNTTLKRNMWAKVSVQYYVDWRVEITDTQSSEKFVHNSTFSGKRVFICLDSKSLGDTIAWLPYVDEFRKKHNCSVICSTFWNDLFKSEYPEIEFVPPGETVYNLEAMYTIGLFYKDNAFDRDRHPKNPIEIPLQQIASDILGIPYTEIRPRLHVAEESVSDSKQVCIAIHSTAQAKYWNNPTGWQEVVDWLNGKGYTVKLLSKEHDGYMGNNHPTGIIQHPESSIDGVIQELKKSKLFIGLGSGLSWLSWALNVPTVIISGFSYPMSEMKDCIRITAPPGRCSGCFNRVRLDAGDWNWCPDHKNTPRQYECSKSITSQMVIKELEKVL